jgi:hypothetical protein
VLLCTALDSSLACGSWRATLPGQTPSIGQGCPKQLCLLPPEQDRQAVQMLPAGSHPLPSHSQGNGTLHAPAVHPGPGLIVCQTSSWPWLSSQEDLVSQGRSEGELPQVPGEPVFADATEATAHCCLSWGPLVLPCSSPVTLGTSPCGVRGGATLITQLLTPPVGKPWGMQREGFQLQCRGWCM